ncbi:diguanylate cyclase [Halopseudomonas pelagia]|uniref:diguanylate cyclase n=2 Tax=Halopseudomonas pelagia TaxID=553151 RepID=A0AA91U5A5_9GAMM|nr:diguanylate cyclase [Halopseudomonas pelagia]QFY58631.1 diguanylate cyclase [Halopseudomonas pelagia]
MQLAADQLPIDADTVPEDVISLRNGLHKLAGSAGTFGFTDLGLQARKLEQVAKNCISQNYLDPASRQRLVRGIHALPHWLFDIDDEQPSERIVSPLTEPLSRSKLIAILETDKMLLAATSQTLNSFGYQTQGFTTFKTLREALKQTLPDALVVAVGQKGIDRAGLDYLAGLQSQLESPLPLIVISEDDNFADQIQAVRAGAQGFFTRPVDLPALENRLEGCFNSLQNEPFRVLIVDDDLDLARRFEAVLSSAGMLAEVVIEPTQLLQQLAHFTPEVVLMDVNMPEYSGPELAQVIRLNDDWLRVPILYISAETDATRQMQALMKAGDDFITKPISDNALLTTVYSRAQRARRVSHALARDSLTGLLKHADIKEQVAIEMERAARMRRPASVAMIDIDHFKSVNDQHGHAVGDNVIRALANLLRQRLRKIDRLGRYGGEEFLAVLPDCDAADAKAILDEIRSAFHDLYFTGAAGSSFQCSFSAGISACNQQSAWQIVEPLEKADAHLYKAKKDGRNRVVA